MIVTDQDPRFLGTCLQQEEELGIEVKFVPEAAHYEMGLIERHNHTWRHMLEKTIDALQIMTLSEAAFGSSSMRRFEELALPSL